MEMAMAMIAVVASAVTTYLTFFDARYRAAAVVAHVRADLQSSYSRVGDGAYQMHYRAFLTPTLIFANQGTRPVLLTRLEFFCADRSRKGGVGASLGVTSEMDALLLEVGSVQHLRPETAFQSLTDDFETRVEQVKMRATAFDHRGKRIEAVVDVATVTFEIVRPEPGVDEAPALNVSVEHPRRQQKIAVGGWLARVGGS